jgi:lipoprotein-anchoring transpeptidase ErfK/SrfK
MKYPILACFAAAVAFATSLFAASPKDEPVQLPPGVGRDDVVRLQIYLDEQNFSPGKVDGQYGGFTRKSWQRYQQAQGITPVDVFNAKAAPFTLIDPIYVNYVVDAQDLASLGEVPHELSLQAKQKSLPYTSMPELIGERYHVSVTFLRQLNAPKDLDHLKAGDLVKVPNVVPPFKIENVYALRQDVADRARARKAATQAPGETGMPAVAPPLGGGSPPPISDNIAAPDALKDPAAPAAPPSPSPSGARALLNPQTAPPAPLASGGLGVRPILRAAPADNSRLVVHISIANDYLEIRDGEKLVACFPITPGSTAIPTPKGEWFVEEKTLLPEFRWDESMLKSGIRSNNFFQLPPGPNNPVGIAWIALNKPGIGIHGTSDPDSIGRSASHGCIRLANWDAFKVYGIVAKGTKVIIE